jgi:hypothetical protein
MTNSPSTVNNFFDQERLRQAAALAGPNTDPVAVIHCSSMFSWSRILDKLRNDKAIGNAEVWAHGRCMTYHGQSRAIWNLSSQTPAPSVADSLASKVKRTSKEERYRDAVDYAKEKLPTEVFELLGLSSD